MIRIVVTIGTTFLFFRVASPALNDLFRGGPKPPDSWPTEPRELCYSD